MISQFGKTLAAGIIVTIASAFVAGCHERGSSTSQGDESTAAKKVAVVNTTCPIMGSKLSPDGVVPQLTRQFQDKTVGFCCSDCLETWDKLTDEQKAAKLAAVMPSPPAMINQGH